ncbi:transcription initiation factor TFIID subunit 7 [Striga asiatica]|uniref:Transcription initiation factor TFIID subunit 7 n=1 Tax=Striga asiatica TaxID=4170 RepID=A0A5A7QYE1_STRAF|nr:transcription initiation factor TFIID subunit 7 [Striga asiatica]GER52301.1 transcription initiation factor TFIID subunit 7 [Striga asiatica]
MEEQFILRVPPAVAERIERLLNDSSSSEDKSLDLSFSGDMLIFRFEHSKFTSHNDGRTGKFVIGNDSFSASLLDLPTVVESYKTYDDNVLIKTADIGQMIMVREEGDSAETGEYRHGLTPPMRDARRRRFRREPDLNPELVRRVEKDLQNIMAEEFDATNTGKNVVSTSSAKPDVPETGMVGGEPDPDGSDSDETDDSM